MKVKIHRVYYEELDDYKEVLDKYKATYYEEDSSMFAMIELNDINEIFNLSEELEQNLVILNYEKMRVCIYDDYME